MADEDKLEPNPDLAPANQNDQAHAEKPSLEPLVVELRDKYLRAVAETENIRKRAERDVADARAYGIAAFAHDVLAVADNLARAIESLDPGSPGGGGRNVQGALGRGRAHAPRAAQDPWKSMASAASSRLARSSTPISIRPCSRSRPPSCPPAPSRR